MPCRSNTCRAEPSRTNRPAPAGSRKPPRSSNELETPHTHTHTHTHAMPPPNAAAALPTRARSPQGAPPVLPPMLPRRSRPGEVPAGCAALQPSNAAGPLPSQNAPKLPRCSRPRQGARRVRRLQPPNAAKNSTVSSRAARLRRPKSKIGSHRGVLQNRQRHQGPVPSKPEPEEHVESAASSVAHEAAQPPRPPAQHVHPGGPSAAGTADWSTSSGAALLERRGRRVRPRPAASRKPPAPRRRSPHGRVRPPEAMASTGWEPQRALQREPPPQPVQAAPVQPPRGPPPPAAIATAASGARASAASVLPPRPPDRWCRVRPPGPRSYRRSEGECRLHPSW
jgi:hypothetical protein